MKKIKDDRLCAVCKKRRPVSLRKNTEFSRNKYHWAYRHDHDICQECWRAIRDRTRTGVCTK